MSLRDRGSDGPVITRWIRRLNGTGEELRTAESFVLAGIDWAGPAQARIELRARGLSGRWTPWMRASVLGHDSDRGESIAHALVGEPLWTGPADALQLRSDVPVDGVNVHVVRAASVNGPRVDAATAPHGAHRPQPPTAAGIAQELPLATPDLPTGPGQPPIIARRAWAHDLLPRRVPLYGDGRMAFVHHSVNGNGYSAGEVPAMLRSIYVFHTYSRGWNDFGYNFAVDAYGRIWEGRAGGIDRPVVGAQAGGYNAESFGVVLLGDFAAALPTDAAQQAIAHLIAWKLALHGVPASGRVTVEVDPSGAHYTRYRRGQHVSLPRVAAHREGCTTDCPGYDMYVNGMPPLRRAVARMVGRQHQLTLNPGPGPGSGYQLAPYAIAPDTRIKPASFLDLQTVTVPAGGQLPLHGALRTLAGAPLEHARIVVQDLSATRHDDPASDVAEFLTQADGVWRGVLQPSANMLLRALHAGAPAAVSALLIVALKPDLTLAVTPSTTGVSVTGTVFPFKPQVLIEARSAGAARSVVAHESTTPDEGFFEARMRLPRGRYWLTARTPADAATVAGESPAVAVQIL